MSKLFSPAKVGRYSLSHRVVLAPLTRMRAEAGAVPGKLMAEYYGQRATQGGFLIAEATSVAANGSGYLGAPAMYDDAQAAGWKKIVDAAHAKGAKIFLQLYHSGRQSHSDLQPAGVRPVGPSEILHGGVAHTESGWVPNTPNRALHVAEIRGLVENFRSAARRAMDAGFDGVELHGANGYLVDQFLQDGSNKRTDEYGGSVANRARFLLEVTDALVSVWGADRVGVRIGPSGSFGDMSDSDPDALFSFVARELDKRSIAYLHLIEPRVRGNVDDESRTQQPVGSQLIRQHFKGTIIAAGGFKGESAEAIVREDTADLIAFGRDFISNPDLPERLRHQLPLTPYDRDSFFGGTEIGYTDYPFAEQELAA